MRNIFDNPLLLIVLLLIIVLVFGSKRLPDAARSIGRSMRIFKSEVKEMKDDDSRASGSTAADSPPPLEGRVVDDRARGEAHPDHRSQPDRRDEPHRADERRPGA